MEQSPPAAQEVRLRGHSLENSRLFFQPITPGSLGNWHSCPGLSAQVVSGTALPISRCSTTPSAANALFTIANGSLPWVSGAGNRFSCAGSHEPSESTAPHM